MRINYIHECVEAGIIALKYINSANEVADVLTKLLPIEPHEQHTQFLLSGHNANELVVIPNVPKTKGTSTFKFDRNKGKFFYTKG